MHIKTFFDKYSSERDCQNLFKKITVKRRSETIFDNKIPLKKWFMAIYLMTHIENGVTTYDLCRLLNLQQKNAELIIENINYAIKHPDF